MNKCFLYYIFFLLLSFQTLGSDAVEHLGNSVERVGDANLQGAQHLLPSERVDDESDLLLTRQAPAGAALNTERSRPAEEFEPLERSESRGLLSEEIDEEPYLPQDEQALKLFEALDDGIFNPYDSPLAKILRWTGRGLGAMADNAMVPMILYVILGLINTQTNDAFDYTVIALMLAYLLLPTTENMAQLGQNVYDACSDCCSNKSQIPVIYKGITSWPSKLLTGGSALHAAGMALVLTNIFHNIEDSKVAQFNWFYWTFVFPYGIGIFNRYYSFFRYGQVIDKAHHYLEKEGQRRTRQILEDSLTKFDTVNLRKLSHEDLKELYLFLKEPDNSAIAKLRKISLITNSDLLGIINDDMNLDDYLSSTERAIYARSWTIKTEIAAQVFNLFFYASAVGEYMLYQYGIALACTNFGMTSPTTISVISNLSATIMSILSFLFESKSVEKLYKETAERNFGSSYSSSNPYLRTGIGIKTFLTASIIALSETYPAWSKTINGDSVAWPLLVFMALRHHARNMYWLRGGYDRVITNWHLRDCWRTNCSCTRCRPGSTDEEMIDHISTQYVHKILTYTDQLNAAGVVEFYKAYFGHDPKHD